MSSLLQVPPDHVQQMSVDICSPAFNIIYKYIIKLTNRILTKKCITQTITTSTTYKYFIGRILTYLIDLVVFNLCFTSNGEFRKGSFFYITPIQPKI